MEPVLKVEGLVKHFGTGRALFALLRGKNEPIRAVDGVTFELLPGESLGIIGESGSGKTTLARTVLLLLRPDAGRIFFMGRDITLVPERNLRSLRPKAQMVFQDPNWSLDPRMKVLDIVTEPLRGAGIKDRTSLHDAAMEAVRAVGLPETSLNRYPHEFSGGGRQRISIARAIVGRPNLVVLDEPTSALDVSVQAQILNLLKRLQKVLGMSYIFITHNFDVAKYMSHRLAVMYLGKFVEVGPTPELAERPVHPYTRLLLASVPSIDPKARKLQELQLLGEPPSALRPPTGCRFHNRCPLATRLCGQAEPPLTEVSRGHMVACHFVGELIRR
ncbi:MAG: peptide ABC transporter substrate-binding protein [Nitrososphaerota archaeon]